ncbi:hypothetical protein ebA1873 [Aromatoleum aromaticum EbN1]|uniref:Uncharacterized protein n=1 Tax=Aromatoleum aromaticum (strain DSM 19018 / LMG 30748 / EbN1) TaxID=76114 RepID=Q5P6B8_AROAE|nr:hypothetical protein ebA1873 [Aromatoleum aromaticum EbN1]
MLLEDRCGALWTGSPGFANGTNSLTSVQRRMDASRIYGSRRSGPVRKSVAANRSAAPRAVAASYNPGLPRSAARLPSQARPFKNCAHLNPCRARGDKVSPPQHPFPATRSRNSHELCG